MRVLRGASLGLAVIAAGGLAGGSEGDRIPFPVDYRTWAHVKTVLLGPESAVPATEMGIHHIYANRVALEGYRTGRFPDGSVLVYDLLEAVEVEGGTREGAQRRVDVMIKEDSLYPKTGGWGFASFAPDDRRPGLHRPACFGCHEVGSDHDHVVSRFRDAGGPAAGASGE